MRRARWLVPRWSWGEKKKSLPPSCGRSWSRHPSVDGLPKASRLYKYGRILFNIILTFFLFFRATRDWAAVRPASLCPRQWFPSPRPACPTRVWSTPASTLPTTTVSRDWNSFQTCRKSNNCEITLHFFILIKCSGCFCVVKLSNDWIIHTSQDCMMRLFKCTCS